MTNDIDDYTRQAVAAVRRAVRSESDFPGWLASVLATAVSDHEQGGFALVTGRPGSWEAEHVHRLIVGTVGEDDAMLGMYRAYPGGPEDPDGGAGR